jgi:hypothetical protein
MRNLKCSVTKGETKVFRFDVEPSDSVTGKPTKIPLTGWTVTFTLQQNGTAVTGFTALACVNDSDQVTYKSVTRLSLNSTQTNSIAAGTYHWHLDGDDGAGHSFRFPNTQQTNFGEFKVWPA